MRKTEKYRQAVKKLDVLAPIADGWNGENPAVVYARITLLNYTWAGRSWQRTDLGVRRGETRRDIANVYVYAASRTDAYQVADLIAHAVKEIGGAKVMRRVHMAEPVIQGKFRVIVNFLGGDDAPAEDLPF